MANRGRRAWRNILSKRLIVDDYSAINHNERAVAFKQAVNASLHTKELIPDVAVKAAMGMGGGSNEDTDNRKREFSADARPGVEIDDRGYRWEPQKSREEGDELYLFPSYRSRRSLSTEPNFGWLKPNIPKFNSFEEMLESMRNKPAVKLTKYKVNPKTDDLDENSAVELDPFSPMSGMSREERRRANKEKKSEVEEKSLGRSLKDRMPGGTLIGRVAAMAGVIMDERNKFRCPPGTPAANQYTDRFGSNCFGFSPSRAARYAARMAQEVYPESSGGPRKGVRKLMDYLYTGNAEWFSSPATWGRTPFYDADGKRIPPPEYRTVQTPPNGRWLKNAFANAQDQVASQKAGIRSLQAALGVDTSDAARATNADLIQTLDRLGIRVNTNMGDGDMMMSPDQVKEWSKTRLERVPGWTNLSLAEQEKMIEADSKRYYETQRGILEGIIDEIVKNPELAERVGQINFIQGSDDEASTALYDTPDGIKARIDINLDEIMTNQESMIPNMGPNERLAIAVSGARSDAEAAKAGADFLVSADVAARSFAGMIDGAYSFASHIGKHEMQHVFQADAFLEKAAQQIEAKGFIEIPFRDSKGNFRVRQVTSIDQLRGDDLMGLMLGSSRDVNFSAVDEVLERASIVSLLGGSYPNDCNGCENESRWLLELSAELGALRAQGFFSGEDLEAVNRFMEWQDKHAFESVERRRRTIEAAEAAREDADSYTPDAPDAVDIDPDSIPLEEIDAIYGEKVKDYTAKTKKAFEEYKEKARGDDERTLITEGAQFEVASLETRERLDKLGERIDEITNNGEIKEEDMDEPTLRALKKLQYERQIETNKLELMDGAARIAQGEWKKRFSATGRTRAAGTRWATLMEDELLRAGWDRKRKTRIAAPGDEDMPDVPEPDDPAAIRDEVKELLKSDSPEKVEKRIINKLKERALITDKESDEYLRATEELNAMGEEYVAKLRAGGDKRKVATIKRELDEKIYKALSKDRKTKKFKSKAESKEYAKKTRAKHRRKLSPEERRAVDELGAFDSADILKMTDPSQQVSAGRAINSRNARLKRMGMEADPKSVDEGALDEQVQNVLIPAMEAMDKTSVDEPFEIETVMVFDPKMLSGRVTGTELEVKGFVSGSTMPGGKSSVDVPKKGPDGTKARRVVVTVNRGDRGMFSTPQKGDDKDRFVMPPGRFRIVGVEKDGTVRAEYVHQADTREVVGTLAATIGEGTDDAIWRKGQQKKLQKVFARHVVSSGDEGKTPAGSRSKEPSEIRDVSTDLVDSVTDMGGSFAEPIDDADVDIPDDSPRKLSSGARDADPIARESIEATRTRLADAVQTVRVRRDQEREEAVQEAEDKLSRMQSAMRKFEQTGQWDGAEFGVDEITGTPEEIRTAAEAAVTRARREADLERYIRDNARTRREQGTIDVEDIPDEVAEMLAAETEFIREQIPLGGEVEDEVELFPTAEGRRAVVHAGPDVLDSGVVDPRKAIGDTGASENYTQNTAALNKNTASKYKEAVENLDKRIAVMQAMSDFATSDDDELVLPADRGLIQEVLNMTVSRSIDGKTQSYDILTDVQSGKRISVKKSDLMQDRLGSYRSPDTARDIEELRIERDKNARMDSALAEYDYQYQSAYQSIIDGLTPNPYYGRHNARVIPEEIAKFVPEYLVGTARGGSDQISDPEMTKQWRKRALRATAYLLEGDEDTEIVTGVFKTGEAQIIKPVKPLIGVSILTPSKNSQAYMGQSSVMGRDNTKFESVSTAIASRALRQLQRDGRVDMDTVLTDPTLAPDGMPPRKFSSGARSGGPASGSGISRAVAAAAGGSLKGRVLGKVVDKILDRTGADEDTKDNVKVGLGLISAFGAGGPAGAATYVAIEAARRGGRDLAEFVVDELVERGRMSPDQAKKAMDAVDRIAPQGLPDGAKRKLGEAFSEAADLFERVNTPENRARLAEMSDEAIDSVVEKAKNAKESVREITDTTVESLRDLGRSARELGGSARDRIRGAGTRFRGRRASEGDGPGLKLSSGSRAERKDAVAIHRQAALGRKEELLTDLDTKISSLEKALEEFERTGEWRGAEYGVSVQVDVPRSSGRSNQPNAGELEPTNPPANYTFDEIKTRLKLKPLGPDATAEEIAKLDNDAKQKFANIVKETIRVQKIDRRILADQIERKRIRREQGTLDVEDIPEEILDDLVEEGDKIIKIHQAPGGNANPFYEIADPSKTIAMHGSQDILEGGRLSMTRTYGGGYQNLSGDTKYLNLRSIETFKKDFDTRQRRDASYESLAKAAKGESTTATITELRVLEELLQVRIDKGRKTRDPEHQELLDQFRSRGSITIDFSQIKDGDKLLEFAGSQFTDERLAKEREYTARMKKAYDTLMSHGGELQSAWRDPFHSADESGYYGKYADVEQIPKDVADIKPRFLKDQGRQDEIKDEYAYNRWKSQTRGGVFLFVGDKDSEITTSDSRIGNAPTDEIQIIAPLKPLFGVSSTTASELTPGSARGSRMFKALMARAVAQYNRDGFVDIDTVLSDPTLAPEPVRSVTAGAAQATELADIDITGRSEAAIREMREGQKSAGNEWITTKSLFSASTKQAEIPSQPQEKLEQETRSERRKVRSQIVATAIRELKLIIGGASSKEFPGLTRADLDPRLIKLLTREPLEVLNARLEKAAMRMHMGFDRRVRIRLTEQELEQLGKTGIMRVGKFGESSEPSRRAMRLMQMDPEYRANRSNRPITQNKTGLDHINDEILSQGLRLASTILTSGKNLGDMSEDEIDMLFNGEVEVLGEKAINPAHTPTFRTKNRSIALAMMAIGQNVELEPSSVTGKVLPEQIVSEATSGALLKVSKDSPEWQDFAEKIGLRSDEMATGEELDNALTQFINDYTIDFCSMPQVSGNLLCVKGIEVDRKEMPQLIGQPSNEQSIAARMFINGMLPGTWVSRISSELEQTLNKLDSANAALKEDTGEQNIALVNSLKTRVTQLESEELKYRKLVARHESPNPKDTEEIKREEDLLETAIEEFEDRLSELQFLERSDDMEKASLIDKIDSSRERLEVIKSMRDGKLSDDERKWLHSKTDWSSVMIDVQPLFSEFVGKVLGTFVNDEPDTVIMDPLDIQPTQHSVSARKVNEFAQDIFMEAEIIDEVLKSRGLYPGSESFNAEKAKVLRDNPVGTRIIVTRENQIIDGHHKWAAVLMVNQSLGEKSKLPVVVTKIDTNIVQALSLAKAFQNAIGITTDYPKSRSFSTSAVRPIGQQEVDTLMNTLVEDAPKLVDELYDNGHFIKISGVSIPSPMSSGLDRVITKMTESSSSDTADERSRFESGSYRDTRSKQDREMTGSAVDKLRRTRSRLDSALRNANLSKVLLEDVKQAAYFVAMAEKNMPLGVISETARRIMRTSGRTLPELMLTELVNDKKLSPSDKAKIQTQMDRSITRKLNDVERGKLKNGFALAMSSIRQTLNEPAVEPEESPFSPVSMARSTIGRRRMDSLRGPVAKETQPKQQSNTPVVSDFVRRTYAKMGIPMSAPDDMLPIHGYVVHKSHAKSRLDAVRERGLGNIEEIAVFELGASDPAGDGIPAYGEIEVVLKKPVSNRAAYSLGQAVSLGGVPVRLNATMREDIADAFYAARNEKGKWANLEAIIGLLTAEITNDYTHVNMTWMGGEEGSHRMFEAFVLGGFDKDEVQQINFPYSMITELADKESISSIVSDKEITAKLQTMGLIPEEIEYVLSMPESQKRTKAEREMKEYLAAQSIKQRLAGMGFENVKIAHPNGFDLDDPRTYSRGARRTDQVLDVLKAKLLDEMVGVAKGLSNDAKKDRSPKIVRREGQQA